MKNLLKPISLCLLIGLHLALPLRAAAHPLDEYLQAIYISLAARRITLEIDLTPALLVAPEVMARLDANNDGLISADEGAAYATAMLNDVSVRVDDQPVSLTLTASEFPSVLNLNAGVGTIRLQAGADLVAPAGAHKLVVQNKHQPVNSAYLINVLQPNKAEIGIAQQTHDEEQHGLQVMYDALGDVADASFINTDQPIANQPTGPAQQLIGFLSVPTLTPALIALAFGLALVLGGLHALTPGHGKTLMAAYLVGSRGTVSHAAFLGGVVTFTHTISVIGAGLLAWLAQQFISPRLLVPVLEIGSGLLVMVMGCGWCWRAGRRCEHARSWLWHALAWRW